MADSTLPTTRYPTTHNNGDAHSILSPQRQQSKVFHSRKVEEENSVIPISLVNNKPGGTSAAANVVKWCGAAINNTIAKLEVVIILLLQDLARLLECGLRL